LRKIILYYAGIFIIIMSATVVNGQVLIDNDLKNLFKDVHQEEDYSKNLKESENEFKILISTSFLIYKKYISSQDTPSCVFYPSCSVYSVEAFQKKGIILGWLYTFDRLSRCHQLVKEKDYPFDIEKNRFYDPLF